LRGTSAPALLTAAAARIHSRSSSSGREEVEGGSAHPICCSYLAAQLTVSVCIHGCDGEDAFERLCGAFPAGRQGRGVCQGAESLDSTLLAHRPLAGSPLGR
jgi:hypothetical protein